MKEEDLLRYIDGATTPEETEQVMLWLNADEKHMEQYLLLRRTCDVLIWHSPNGINHNNHNTDLFPSKKSNRTKYLLKLIRVAAIFLLAIGSYHLVYIGLIADRPTDVLQTIYVADGVHTEITLSDNTKVWLSSNSRLVFPNHFFGNNRTVELMGDGYFDIAHDPSKPFVVKTAQYSVKALGTEFNVRAYPEQDLFETYLIKGSVEVASYQSNADKQILKPNEKVYQKNGTLVMEHLSEPDLGSFLWKQGIIAFEKEPVCRIIEKLELYFGVEIIVKNEDALKGTYTGKFRMQDGAEHVLKVLQGYHKFSYSKESKNIFIINGTK